MSFKTPDSLHPDLMMPETLDDPRCHDQTKMARALITERGIDEPRQLKMVYIGAGISGIVGAIEFLKRLPNLELVIYEKNPEIGGTWFENNYPGCACGELRIRALPHNDMTNLDAFRRALSFLPAQLRVLDQVG